MDIKIANRFVELRKSKGMTQEIVAEKLGLSRQAVSRWERAESTPDMDNLVQLSKLYNISLDELLQTDTTSKDTAAAALQEQHTTQTVENKKETPDALLMQIPFPFVIPVIIIWGLFGFHEGYNWLGKSKPNTLQRFPFPIIIVAAYLLIGFIGNYWDPGWIILLTIPIYYTIAALIKRK